MATIHISEAEAAGDFAGLMARVHSGAEVVIESGAYPPTVLRTATPPRRSIGYSEESVALLPADTTATIGEGFASDDAASGTPSLSDRELRAMEAEIKAADFILGIRNDAGMEDFVPYSRETLTRATSFLRRHMIHAHAANLFDTGVPGIGPADHGSIDLYWEADDRTLLINFPANESDANYYGKKPGSEISGRFDPSEARADIVVWLAE
jgi:hypothetical protein